MKNLITRFTLAMILTATTALAAGDYATCPRDGQQAERTDVEQIHSNSCPENPNSPYNAERDTYSHDYINGAFIERHTFTTTECF